MIAPAPFTDYKVYGPRIHQGRRIIYLVFLEDSSNRTTLSYAKYLLSIKLNRWLDREEQVDHIDGDPLNDLLENLQILGRGNHATKHSKGLKTKTYICGSCKQEFQGRDDGKPHKHCSRSCHYDSMRK